MRGIRLAAWLWLLVLMWSMPVWAQSIAISGTGVVPTAKTLEGTTPTDDSMVIGNGTIWQNKALVQCDETTGQVLKYTVSTNTWGCVTVAGGAGGGDITAVGSCTTLECFTAATPGASLFYTAIAAPATPAAGQAVLYADTANAGVHASKSSAGTVTHMVQSKAAVTNQFLTAISDAGVVTAAPLSLSTLSDGASVVTLTGTQKLINKQIVERLCPATVSANVITPINIDTCDILDVPTLAAATTVDAPTGTGGNPVDGQKLEIRFNDTTPRALTWNAIYTTNGGITLITTTTGVPGKTDRLRLEYKSAVAQWQAIANTQIPATSGGGTGYLNLPIAAARLPMATVTPAIIDTGSNNNRILFDDAASWCVDWQFKLPGDYNGTPVVVFDYVKLSSTNTAHTVQFDVSIMALKTGASIETDSYGTVNTCTDSTSPGSVNFLDTITCTLTNVDAMVANDVIKLRQCLNTASTTTGQVAVVGGQFRYSR